MMYLPFLLQKLGEGVKGVYISIDVDCLDPAFAPGVSHLEPGGLSFRDVMNIVQNCKETLWRLMLWNLIHNVTQLME